MPACCCSSTRGLLVGSPGRRSRSARGAPVSACPCRRDAARILRDISVSRTLWFAPPGSRPVPVQPPVQQEQHDEDAEDDGDDDDGVHRTALSWRRLCRNGPVSLRVDGRQGRCRSRSPCCSASCGRPGRGRRRPPQAWPQLLGHDLDHEAGAARPCGGWPGSWAAGLDGLRIHPAPSRPLGRPTSATSPSSPIRRSPPTARCTSTSPTFRTRPSGRSTSTSTARSW
jgi:hypothetical protein